MKEWKTLIVHGLVGNTAVVQLAEFNTELEMVRIIYLCLKLMFFIPKYILNDIWLSMLMPLRTMNTNTYSWNVDYFSTVINNICLNSKGFNVISFCYA